MKSLFIIMFFLFNFLFANDLDTFTASNNEIRKFDETILIAFSMILMLLTLILLKDNIFLKKEKSQINKQMDKFKTLLEYASDGVHILDLDGNIIDCSKSFCKLLGYSYEETKKLNVRDFDYNINNELVEEFGSQVLNGPLNIETKHQRKDGTTFDVEVTARTILLQNETYVFASARDISERKALEVELSEINKDLENRVKKATKKLNHSLEIIEKSIISSKTDLKGTITEVTDKFCEISKYSREELLGKNHNIVRHEDMPKSAFEEMWETIKSGKTWQGRVKNKAKDGEAYWVDSTVSPYYDEDGNHVGYFSYRIDVTEEIKNLELQKSYNETLQSQVNEQLDEIRTKDLQMIEQSKMASLGEMLNNIAHQWRQPLNVISISASSIECSKKYGILSDEDLMNSISQINDSCKHLTKTIETFARYSDENKDIIKTSIEEEISTAKFIIESSLNSKMIKLIDEINYDENHPITLTRNDLSQVLVNIITNSEDILKNLEQDEKWVKISSIVENNRYIINIEDNGTGINEDIISKIFEPYFTTKFKSQGTGLGLSIAYNIIKNKLNGEISVKNNETGATFSIELPLEKNS